MPKKVFSYSFTKMEWVCVALLEFKILPQRPLVKSSVLSIYIVVLASGLHWPYFAPVDTWGNCKEQSYQIWRKHGSRNSKGHFKRGTSWLGQKQSSPRSLFKTLCMEKISTLYIYIQWYTGKFKVQLLNYSLVLLQVAKCFVPVQILWVSPKIWLQLVPLQKLTCWHKKQFYWIQIIFLSGTKHFATCKRTRHKCWKLL